MTGHSRPVWAIQRKDGSIVTGARAIDSEGRAVQTAAGIATIWDVIIGVSYPAVSLYRSKSHAREHCWPGERPVMVRLVAIETKGQRGKAQKSTSQKSWLNASKGLI